MLFRSHIKNILTNTDNTKTDIDLASQCNIDKKSYFKDDIVSQEEIDMIFQRTFGSIKQKRKKWNKTIISSSKQKSFQEIKRTYEKEDRETYLLVDGYNIIFAWEELNELAKVNIDSARDKLIDIICNY